MNITVVTVNKMGTCASPQTRGSFLSLCSWRWWWTWTLSQGLPPDEAVAPALVQPRGVHDCAAVHAATPENFVKTTISLTPALPLWCSVCDYATVYTATEASCPKITISITPTLWYSVCDYATEAT